MKRILSNNEVNAINRIRYGRMPGSRFDTAYVSYGRLALLWKVSATYIRELVVQRLDELSRSSMDESMGAARSR